MACEPTSWPAAATSRARSGSALDLAAVHEERRARFVAHPAGRGSARVPDPGRRRTSGPPRDACLGPGEPRHSLRQTDGIEGLAPRLRTSATPRSFPRGTRTRTRSQTRHRPRCPCHVRADGSRPRRDRRHRRFRRSRAGSRPTVRATQRSRRPHPRGRGESSRLASRHAASRRSQGQQDPGPISCRLGNRRRRPPSRPRRSAVTSCGLASADLRLRRDGSASSLRDTTLETPSLPMLTP